MIFVRQKRKRRTEKRETNEVLLIIQQKREHSCVAQIELERRMQSNNESKKSQNTYLSFVITVAINCRRDDIGNDRRHKVLQ
jgi:hypothetical protein